METYLEEHGYGGNNDTLEKRLRLEQRADGHELELEDVPAHISSELDV